MHKKPTLLRQLFESKPIVRIIGAHDGLGAKLVERNGFDGVWASGLEISTAHGVPDANILTMTEHLAAASAMNEAAAIPVICDCDTGFGNAANVATVWKWLPATSRWAFYAPSLVAQDLSAYAANKGFDVLTGIGGGEGYWVNARQAFTASLSSGAALLATSFRPRASRALAPNWNLIALGESMSPAAFNLALSVTPPDPGIVPNNVTTLWAWDNARAAWYFYAPSLDATGALAGYANSKGYLDFAGEGKLLGPGVGFWAHRP